VTRAEILAKIQDVMIDVLDLDDLHITEKTTAADVEGWDSLSHLRLITEIEAAFGLTFATGEIERFKDVGDMVGTIETKLQTR
jgi:acyl carrier protein